VLISRRRSSCKERYRLTSSTQWHSLMKACKSRRNVPKTFFQYLFY
jgi:hypothetical protein